MKSNMRYLTWDDITKCCKDISIKLQHDKFDTILSIGRGGMVPSRLISEYLDISDVRIIGCKSYYKINERGDVLIGDFDAKPLENKSILIIDDVCTSGSTIDAVKSYILNKVSTISITVASLYYNKDKNIRKVTDPDLFSEYYSASESWLVFPWENCKL